MTSIDAVPGEILAIDSYGLEREEPREEKSSFSHPLYTTNGSLRMQEEEALSKVLAPNLRHLEEFSERIEKIGTLIKALSSYDKDPACSLCAEKLAPTHPEIALRFADKITDKTTKVKAYFFISQYQSPNAAAVTLSKGGELLHEIFNPTIELLDIPFQSHLPAADSLITNFHARLLNSIRWHAPFEKLLLLAELELKMQREGMANSVQKAHSAGFKGKIDWWNLDSYLRLLKCEAQIGSPLYAETLEAIYACINNAIEPYPYTAIKALPNLLAIEAQFPLLSPSFEKDFQWALSAMEKLSWYYWDSGVYNMVSAIAPYRPTLATTLVEKIESDYKRVPAYLECVKARSHTPQFNPEEELSLFMELLEGVKMRNADGWVSIFLAAADIFGVEKTQFLMDTAIEAAQMDLNDFLSTEIKQGGRIFQHYLGRALGIDFPYPEVPSGRVSPLSYISNWAREYILEGLSTYNLPGTEELLDLFYQELEEGILKSYKVFPMVRAELALALKS